MNWLVVLLRLVHVLAGVLWVGFAVFVPAYLGPAIQETGPDGGNPRDTQPQARAAICRPCDRVDAGDGRYRALEVVRREPQPCDDGGRPPIHRQQEWHKGQARQDLFTREQPPALSRSVES